MIIYLFDFVYFVVFFYELFFGGESVSPFTHLWTQRKDKSQKNQQVMVICV